jgi:hypothetical protein
MEDQELVNWESGGGKLVVKTSEICVALGSLDLKRWSGDHRLTIHRVGRWSPDQRHRVVTQNV